MAECKECGDEVDALVSVKVDDGTEEELRARSVADG